MSNKKKYKDNPKHYNFDKKESVKNPKKFRDLGETLLKKKIKNNSK